RGLGYGTAADDLAGVGTDTFFGGVTRVRGSAYADTIYGSGVGDMIQGGAGDDFIDGRGGNDVAVYTPSRASDVTGGISRKKASGHVTGDGSVGTGTLGSIQTIHGPVFAGVYDARNFGASGFLDHLVGNVGSSGTIKMVRGAGRR